MCLGLTKKQNGTEPTETEVRSSRLAKAPFSQEGRLQVVRFGRLQAHDGSTPKDDEVFSSEVLQVFFSGLIKNDVTFPEFTPLHELQARLAQTC